MFLSALQFFYLQSWAEYVLFVSDFLGSISSCFALLSYLTTYRNKYIEINLNKLTFHDDEIISFSFIGSRTMRLTEEMTDPVIRHSTQ